MERCVRPHRSSAGYNGICQRRCTALAQRHRIYCMGDLGNGIANNILDCKQDSEECVNDTWLQTWNSIPPQKPNCLKAFLAKITRNLSLNRYKEKMRDKRGNGEVVLALDEMDEFLAGTSDVVSEYEQKEFLAMLNRFLYSLPERERSIFILRYFYMDSTKDIARAHSIKESNVLMILSRTRKKLKETLEREGYTI